MNATLRTYDIYHHHISYKNMYAFHIVATSCFVITIIFLIATGFSIAFSSNVIFARLHPKWRSSLSIARILCHDWVVITTTVMLWQSKLCQLGGRQRKHRCLPSREERTKSTHLTARHLRHTVYDSSRCFHRRNANVIYFPVWESYALSL